MKRINIILTDEDIQNIDRLKDILKDQTGLDYNTTQAIRYALRKACSSSATLPSWIMPR